MNPLLEAPKFCGTHENYEKTLMETLEKIELTELRAEKLICSLTEVISRMKGKNKASRERYERRIRDFQRVRRKLIRF